MLMSKYSLEQDCPSKNDHTLFSRYRLESIHVALKKGVGEVTEQEPGFDAQCYSVLPLPKITLFFKLSERVKHFFSHIDTVCKITHFQTRW